MCLGLGLPGWLLGPVARAHTMPGMRRDEEERSYLKGRIKSHLENDIHTEASSTNLLATGSMLPLAGQ